MSQSRLVVLVLLAGMLAVAGCGKSAGSSSSATQPSKGETGSAQTVASGPPLPRAVFVAKADAVCRRLKSEESHLDVRTKSEFASGLAKLKGWEATALAKLAKLVPPAALAGEWRQTMADARVLSTDTIRALEFATTRGFKAASSTTLFTDTAAARKRALADARRLGLNDCAQTI
jgi:hypothetical protein